MRPRSAEDKAILRTVALRPSYHAARGPHAWEAAEAS